MKTTAGSISTGDHLIIEINRGLKVKNEPPRQLKTVPLTAAGLAAAQASAAALSKANSRTSKAPESVSKSETGGPVTAAAGREPARKGASRGTTFTMIAIGALAIACAGAAWTQRSTRTVVTAPPAVATAEAPQAAPAAQPAAAETALGFVVAPRPPTTGETTPAEAKVEAPLPAPPATGTQVAASPAPAEAAPEPTAKRSGARPRTAAEPVAKADPPAAATPKPKAPEKAAAAAPEEKKPTPAAAPSSVDAILQQQLKSAIP